MQVDDQLVQPSAADHPHTVARSAFRFLSGTALSRISGLLRDMSMAFFFGTSPSIAAFLVALRLATLFRRILGEGALLNSFIPYFESHRTENPARAAEFFRDTFFSLIVLLALVIGTFEIGIYMWGQQIGFSLENQQIFQLIMIIVPGVLFICLFGICSGLLQCEKRFFLTGASPIMYNVVWIASIWICKDCSHETAAVGLAIGITLAFLAQWLITFPKTLSFLLEHLSYRQLIRFRIFSLDIRKMLSSLSLGVIGVTAAQVNTAIDTIFARCADLEGPAYLNYAIHLQQLPLALFGIGIASALLPPLSRAYKSDQIQQYHRLLEFSLATSLFLVIPCTIAIFSLGGSSVNLIFGRGEFDHASTLRTTLCLWGYGLGLVPMVATLLLAPAFYAKKDYKTPMKAALLSIAVNVSLNTLFIRGLSLGPESLPVSTSIAACSNVLFLYAALSRKTGIRLSAPFFHSLFKTIVCSVLAGGLTVLMGCWFLEDPTLSILFSEKVQFIRDFQGQLFQFLGLFAVFVISFMSAALALKSKELFELFRIVRHSTP